MLSFREFSFPPGQDFVPSKPTMNHWLYTKKIHRTFSGVVLPGLFETVGYSTQMIAFFGILALEAVPTIYGVDQGVMWEGILAAILVDIVLALFAHRWHDKICKCQNELVFETNSISKVALRRRISRYRLYTNFFYVLIIVSGVFKFLLFYAAYMVIGSVTIAVFVCYLLGALLHIAYTGYFIYTSRFNYKIQSEYTQYITNGGNTNNNQIGKLVQKIPMNGTVFQVTLTNAGEHSITKDDDNYISVRTGVLTDNELEQLVLKQPVQTQGFIAQEILKRQFELL